MATFPFSSFLIIPAAFMIISPCLVLKTEAKVVRYTFEVYYISGSPDGVFKDKILAVNEQFPGPTIEAYVGDTVEIRVINKIQDGQNTSIHWHGIHQRGTQFEDGVSQVTQCPLPVNASQVYRFQVTTPGTYWYHSHEHSQYTEGFFGALIVHGYPEHYKYDGELTLILSDWYHRTAKELREWYVSPRSLGISPYPHTALMNGLGRYPCCYATVQNRLCNKNLQRRQIFTTQQGATYRVRIINAGAVASFNFSIDGHRLDVIEVDGLDVAKSVYVEQLSIFAGQRYSVLIKPTNMGRHLIRATLRKEDLTLVQGANVNPFPEATIGEVTSVLNVMYADLRHEPNRVLISTEKFNYNETLPPPPISNLILFDQMKLSPLEGPDAPEFFDQEFTLLSTFAFDANGVRMPFFNRTPFVLPDDKPLLMTFIDDGSLPASSNPLEINFGNVVQLILNNPIGRPHPFHLHGHHFWVVGVGADRDGGYDRNLHNLTLSGVKRDTINVESWAVIRFVADNPGIWTFHCHIEWHNLAGMVVTFVEAGDLLRQNVKPTDEALRVCSLHA